MKKTLMLVCALFIVLGAALTAYAAPEPPEAPSPPVSPKPDGMPAANEAVPEAEPDGSSPDPADYFEVNEQGQTYGFDKYDNVTPDLIAAIGLNGVHGYVYQTELLSAGAKRSPDDAVTDIPASIPLYASDGVTVLGQFPLGPRSDDVRGDPPIDN